MKTSPSSLLPQIRRRLAEYESGEQVIVAEKALLAQTIAGIIFRNRHRWGKYPDVNPRSGVADAYVDDVIRHYLAHRRFIDALNAKQRTAWQLLLDHLAARIYWRLTLSPWSQKRLISTQTQDFTQHCATLVWQRLDAYPFDCSFWAWVEVFLSHEIGDVLKSADYRHNNFAARVDALLEDAASREASDEPYDDADTRLLLDMLLAGLTAEQQTAIELTLSGLSGDEIATRMNRSVSAVNNLKSRAYARMREKLGEEAAYD